MTSLPPFTARRIRFIAESGFPPGVPTAGTPPGRAGTSMRMSAGAGAIRAGLGVESALGAAGAVLTPAFAGRFGGVPETIARGSSAAAKPEEAGAGGAAGLAGNALRVATPAGRLGAVSGAGLRKPNIRRGAQAFRES